jgi:hypothetical protein
MWAVLENHKAQAMPTWFVQPCPVLLLTLFLSPFIKTSLRQSISKSQETFASYRRTTTKARVAQKKLVAAKD